MVTDDNDEMVDFIRFQDTQELQDLAEPPLPCLYHHADPSASDVFSSAPPFPLLPLYKFCHSSRSYQAARIFIIQTTTLIKLHDHTSHTYTHSLTRQTSTEEDKNMHFDHRFHSAKLHSRFPDCCEQTNKQQMAG